MSLALSDPSSCRNAWAKRSGANRAAFARRSRSSKTIDSNSSIALHRPSTDPSGRGRRCGRGSPSRTPRRRRRRSPAARRPAPRPAPSRSPRRRGRCSARARANRRRHVVVGDVAEELGAAARRGARRRSRSRPLPATISLRPSRSHARIAMSDALVRHEPPEHEVRVPGVAFDVEQLARPPRADGSPGSAGRRPSRSGWRRRSSWRRTRPVPAARLRSTRRSQAVSSGSRRRDQRPDGSRSRGSPDPTRSASACGSSRRAARRPGR